MAPSLAELVIGHLALGVDGEVRRDQALRAPQRTVAAGDLPDHRAALDAGERARAEQTAAEGLECDRAGLPVGDGAGLDKDVVADDLDLRLEGRALTSGRLDGDLDPVGLEGAA